MLFRRKDLVHRSMNLVHSLIEAHFRPIHLDKLSLTERRFPHRVRADLQRAVENLLDGRLKVLGSYGLFKHYNHQGIDFAELLIQGGPDPAQAVPPLYEEIDIGEDRPVRCLKNGLWPLESDGSRLAVLLERYAPFGQIQGMRFQVATPSHSSRGENDTESAVPSCLKVARSRPEATSKSRMMPWSGPQAHPFGPHPKRPPPVR